MHTRICYEKPQEKNHSEDLRVDERIILEWMGYRVGKCGLNTTHSGKG
jgi:hypothetical protein